MPRQARAVTLEDFSRFAILAGHLEHAPAMSLRQIADRMGVSAASLQDLIRRVEKHLGDAKLVHTTEKVAVATALTTDGARFVQEIRRLYLWRPVAPNHLRLALSHTLLTSHLLTPALAAFRDQNLPVRVDLRLGTVVMNFGQIIKDLQTDKLDVAITWATNGRGGPFPGIDQGEFDHAFDLVLIGRNPDEVAAAAADGRRMSRMRVVTMRPENQPGIAILPPPDAAEGGERLEADTVGEVIACIQAGVGDIGLVAANYSILEPLRMGGQMYFSGPVGKAKIMWCRSRSATGPTLNLIPFLQAYVAGTPGLTTRGPHPAVTELPANARFYGQFAHVWYLARPRWPAPPRWQRAEMRIVPDTGSTEDTGCGGYPIMMRGRFLAPAEVAFEVAARVVSPWLLHAQITSAPEEPPPAPQRGFVATFHWCAHSASNTVLYGHWVAEHPGHEGPALFAMFWSREPLGAGDLRQLTHHVRARTVFGIDVDPESPARPMTPTPAGESGHDSAPFS